MRLDDTVRGQVQNVHIGHYRAIEGHLTHTLQDRAILWIPFLAFGFPETMYGLQLSKVPQISVGQLRSLRCYTHIVPVVELVAQSTHVWLNLLMQLLLLLLTNELRYNAHVLFEIPLLRRRPQSMKTCQAVVVFSCNYR